MTPDEFFAELRAQPANPGPAFALGQPVRVRLPNGDVRRGVVIEVRGSATVVPKARPLSVDVRGWRYVVQIPHTRNHMGKADQISGWDVVSVLPEDTLEPAGV